MAIKGRILDEEFLSKIRELPCLICGTPGPSDPCHVTVRKLLGDARNNVFPACRECHVEQHTLGIRTFGRKYNLPITDDIYPVLSFEWEI